MLSSRAAPIPLCTGDVAADREPPSCRQAISAPKEGSRPEGTLGLLLALHDNNVVQWKCEDESRRHSGNDAAVAAAKREIDALNTKRHGLVEALDAALAAEIEQSASAPPTTESPAMVLDRLSVLVLRLASTEDAANSERTDRNIYAARFV